MTPRVVPRHGGRRPGRPKVMRVQLRIVAGSLRGRKLTCTTGAGLRPAPQRLREALFSILGNAVPDRPFFDVFAGTGAVGLEALSRGAAQVTFVERDFRTAAEIESHLRAFGVADQASVLRRDAYHWAQRWQAPLGPANVFLGPPYPDLQRRPGELLIAVSAIQGKAAPGSAVIVQVERGPASAKLPTGEGWDVRSYGRNQLHIWVKEPPAADQGAAPNELP